MFNSEKLVFFFILSMLVDYGYDINTCSSAYILERRLQCFLYPLEMNYNIRMISESDRESLIKGISLHCYIEYSHI